MLILLSPSKTLDETSALPKLEVTQPEFLEETRQLAAILKKYTPKKLGKLMDISDKLAALNAERYTRFSTPFTLKNARPALWMFKGDVYDGIDIERYRAKDVAFAQKHLRMLSGLYGLLRPLDLMQPYRLEMGTRLKNARGKDLYAFWGDRITDAINREKSGPVINLASEEYFAAVQESRLKTPLVSVVFKDFSGGSYKIIGLFAKKARGVMANWIIRNALTDMKDLKAFAENGYRCDAKNSTASQLVFTRKAA